MSTRKKDDHIQPVFAWAWKIRDDKGRWVLCHWAEPTREQMLARAWATKPSPEARPVRVVMTPAPKRRRMGNRG